MFHAHLDDFFVVAVISNTARFKKRAHLFDQFAKHLRESEVDHVLVELAFGDRSFHCTNSVQVNHLRLRTVEEFWHKENLINLGIAHGLRLWPNKRMVMWSDADCAPIGKTFKEWFEEVWHELQHHEFVQCWSWLQHLDNDHQPLGHGGNPSFMYNYVKYGYPYPDKKHHHGYPKQWGSPGLAWAANVSALNHIGGIGDVGITGGGDWYLAHLLISDLPFQDFIKGGYTEDYINYWRHKQMLAERWIKRDVGYVRSYMLHHFHGKIRDRGYNWREKILRQGQFQPTKDLKRDFQGLWQLETNEPRQIWMRDQLRRYARVRNEDSIDHE
jgi:hypothetical protein